jgi:hypothetical protein
MVRIYVILNTSGKWKINIDNQRGMIITGLAVRGHDRQE